MVNTVNKSFLWWLAILAIMILLCLVIYRVSAALYHNDRLQKEFSTELNPSSYQQGIPMEEMELSAYSSYFPNIYAMPNYQITHHIETPVKISYYSEIPTAETIPALEINKGATIRAIQGNSSDSGFYDPGYGYTSYPTYDQGWRYVRPFELASEDCQQFHEQYYYVRIEALEAVIDKVIQVNPSLRSAIRQQGWSVHTGKHNIATYIDQIFYQNGVYLSPDLFLKVIDRWNIMMIASIGVLILSMTFGKRKWFT